MNIFVTVGTTSFDSLTRVIDSGPYANDTLMQIADGAYLPSKAKWFSFKPSVENHINEANIIVCHAGAGSIFRFLQSGLIPIVVPNTERRDKHQLEIATWLSRKQYAVVAMKPTDVNHTIANYHDLKKDCVEFSEQRFFHKDELNHLIKKNVVSLH